MSPPINPRAFPVEFKKQVVRKVFEEGPGTSKNRTIAEIAREFGTFDSNYYAWKRQHGAEVRAEMEAETIFASARQFVDAEANADDPGPDPDAVEYGPPYEGPYEAEKDPDLRTVEFKMAVPTFLTPLTREQLERMGEFVMKKLQAVFGEEA